MFNQLRPAIVLTVLLSAVTGLLYPMAIAGMAQAAFPAQANGSRVVMDGVTIGSDLIGQNFVQPGYFRPRPSATGGEPYNAGASGGSNIGPTGKALVDRVAASVDALGGGPVPADAVTTSGSGLDPHISPQYAALQVGRVAEARGVDPAAIEAMLADMTEQPLLGILGEPRVNVLRLNLALDEAAPLGN
ncbi:potassium-transporting ATPase subunit KdpC [Devosia ginsengisoli]|uniref:Potassium-transporting ATPase KdpC subunit n=1 Tax=Devosia ginsengisoli TaxID=400770 RepID=A0A5B8LXP4_9HYPH|nr:potassium-transporting ATPase subunit KdpC [Devosia ginsengisoli]QDZ12579.1 potassium-transporting ATPase subunit KdpC [Devosia ginsengisoli]